MKAPLLIETARLTLSPPRTTDVAAIFARYAGDADVTRFMSWPRHRTVSDTLAFVTFSAGEWERWPAGPYLIWSRSDGKLLGSTGLAFETPDLAGTGYVLAKDAWGRGYATEALTAVIEIACQTGVVCLYALCHPEHQPSWHVLEKCGFVHDSSWTGQAGFPNLAPGVPQDTVRYELLLDA